MARFHCPGSNTLPLVADATEYEGMKRTKVSETFTQYHHPDYGVCEVCHEPKKLLKSGKLPKHTRYVSWKDQEAARKAGVDLGPAKS